MVQNFFQRSTISPSYCFALTQEALRPYTEYNTPTIHDEHADLIIKHLASIDPNPAIIDAALARAGGFRVISADLHSDHSG